MELRGSNFIGILFYGANGYMVVEDSGFKILLGDKREPGEAMKMVEGKQDESLAHVSNFLQAVRSRRWQDLVAEVREAAISADLVHMANASCGWSNVRLAIPDPNRAGPGKLTVLLLHSHVIQVLARARPVIEIIDVHLARAWFELVDIALVPKQMDGIDYPGSARLHANFFRLGSDKIVTHEMRPQPELQ